jgi:transcription elongation GreA/GreB family factor
MYDLTRRIDEEIERLSRDLVIDIPEALGVELDSGSHQLLIERQKRVLDRIRRLGRIRLGIHRWGSYALPVGAIGIGSQVVLRNVDSGAEERRVVVGASVDLAADEVALDSPIGAALIGRRFGDTVHLAETGGPDESYHIVEVTTLCEFLVTQRC